MGILGLGTLINERAPQAVKQTEMKHYFGRKIAIDASMSIYQFVIAMQGFNNGESTELQNAAGEVTTHLNGLWTRTLRMIDEGIKPVYVFDGKPPELKRKELQKRNDRAAAATAALEEAKETGDDDAMMKAAARTVRLSRDQLDECRKLLALMGLPVVQSASEAEAQCVDLVKAGKAWAIATEDMDSLAFGAPILIRHLGAGDPKKRPVMEYRTEALLQQLGFTMEQFIDLCILMGCDYCCKIPGIGAVKAFEQIQMHKSIEKVIENLDQKKYPVPENFCYKEARELFLHPDVTPATEIEIVFREPDVEGLMKFMVDEKMFDPTRIEKGIQRLKAALEKKTQMRLDTFFSVKAAPLPLHATQLPKQAGQRRGAAQPGASQQKPANAAEAKAKGHKKAVSKH